MAFLGCIPRSRLCDLPPRSPPPPPTPSRCLDVHMYKPGAVVFCSCAIPSIWAVTGAFPKGDRYLHVQSSGSSVQTLGFSLSGIPLLGAHHTPCHHCSSFPLHPDRMGMMMMIMIVYSYLARSILLLFGAIMTFFVCHSYPVFIRCFSYQVRFHFATLALLFFFFFSPPPLSYSFGFFCIFLFHTSICFGTRTLENRICQHSVLSLIHEVKLLRYGAPLPPMYSALPCNTVAPPCRTSCFARMTTGPVDGCPLKV